ncbi:MAG: cation:proton antiporter [Betaproteobacteria bacterium]
MMTTSFGLWALVAGVLLIAMAFIGTWVERMPLSPAMLYLGAGFALGPSGAGMLLPDPKAYSPLLERLAESAVLISVFVTALRISVPLKDRRWRLPISLASVAMIATVGLIAAVGVAWLALPLGAAILLGAILAPTDPVLASDVQLDDPRDRDLLRFSLSGEAGLNDGTALPLVLLGMGLLGLHELGAAAGQWLLIDVLWSVAGGLAIGWVLAASVGKLILHLRTRHQLAIGLNEFLALGLIALVYGIALLAHASGFLAVFAAGLALPRMRPASHASLERLPVAQTPGAGAEIGAGEASAPANATHPVKAPAHMAHAVLSFDEQLERFAEIAMVLVVGAMFSYAAIPPSALWFIPLLLLVIRPLSVLIAGAPAMSSGIQLPLIAWFGIRGIGSIYYLLYAVNRGLPDSVAPTIVGLTLVTVVVSIVAHGISIPPLMGRYRRRKRNADSAGSRDAGSRRRGRTVQ